MGHEGEQRSMSSVGPSFPRDSEYGTPKGSNLSSAASATSEKTNTTAHSFLSSSSRIPVSAASESSNEDLKYKERSSRQATHQSRRHQGAMRALITTINNIRENKCLSEEDKKRKISTIIGVKEEEINLENEYELLCINIFSDQQSLDDSGSEYSDSSSNKSAEQVRFHFYPKSSPSTSSEDSTSYKTPPPPPSSLKSSASPIEPLTPPGPPAGRGGGRVRFEKDPRSKLHFDPDTEGPKIHFEHEDEDPSTSLTAHATGPDTLKIKEGGLVFDPKTGDIYEIIIINNEDMDSKDRERIINELLQCTAQTFATRKMDHIRSDLRLIAFSPHERSIHLVTSSGLPVRVPRDDVYKAFYPKSPLPNDPFPGIQKSTEGLRRAHPGLPPNISCALKILALEGEELLHAIERAIKGFTNIQKPDYQTARALALLRDLLETETFDYVQHFDPEQVNLLISALGRIRSTSLDRRHYLFDLEYFTTGKKEPAALVADILRGINDGLKSCGESIAPWNLPITIKKNHGSSDLSKLLAGALKEIPPPVDVTAIRTAYFKDEHGYVTHINEEFPKEFGLKVGDRIVSINGKNPDEKDGADPKRIHTIKVIRDGAEVVLGISREAVSYPKDTVASIFQPNPPNDRTPSTDSSDPSAKARDISAVKQLYSIAHIGQIPLLDATSNIYKPIHFHLQIKDRQLNKSITHLEQEVRVVNQKNGREAIEECFSLSALQMSDPIGNTIAFFKKRGGDDLPRWYSLDNNGRTEQVDWSAVQGFWANADYHPLAMSFEPVAHDLRFLDDSSRIEFSPIDLMREERSCMELRPANKAEEKDRQAVTEFLVLLQESLPSEIDSKLSDQLFVREIKQEGAKIVFKNLEELQKLATIHKQPICLVPIEATSEKETRAHSIEPKLEEGEDRSTWKAPLYVATYDFPDKRTALEGEEGETHFSRRKMRLFPLVIEKEFIPLSSPASSSHSPFSSRSSSAPSTPRSISEISLSLG